MNSSLGHERCLFEFRNQVRHLVEEEFNPPSIEQDPNDLVYQQKMERLTFEIWKKTVEDALNQQPK